MQSVNTNSLFSKNATTLNFYNNPILKPSMISRSIYKIDDLSTLRDVILKEISGHEIKTKTSHQILLNQLEKQIKAPIGIKRNIIDSLKISLKKDHTDDVETLIRELLSTKATIHIIDDRKLEKRNAEGLFKTAKNEIYLKISRWQKPQEELNIKAAAKRLKTFFHEAGHAIIHYTDSISAFTNKKKQEAHFIEEIATDLMANSLIANIFKEQSDIAKKSGFYQNPEHINKFYKKNYKDGFVEGYSNAFATLHNKDFEIFKLIRNGEMNFHIIDPKTKKRTYVKIETSIQFKEAIEKYGAYIMKPLVDRYLELLRK